jgi:peptide/nickel transport system permease protein
VAIVLGVAAAPWLAPYPVDAVDLNHRLAAPGAAFPLGSDALGRDVLTRLLYGGRVSLLVGAVAVAISALIGGSLGLISGYVGGIVDGLVMRIVDVFQAVPYVVLALGISVVIGPGLETLLLVLALSTWTTFARLLRTEVRSIRVRDSVVAARVIGAGTTRILVRHILPQVAGTLAVSVSLMVGSTILFEASLSFLGLGVQRPTPSWGNMLLDGIDLLSLAPWVSAAPGAAVLLTSLAINVLGDALRDALDPRR